MTIEADILEWLWARPELWGIKEKAERLGVHNEQGMIAQIEAIKNDTFRITYNPNYGSNKLCNSLTELGVCGHPYYRHFDGYDNNEACGCKYCPCYTFTE